jgi:ABC-2 type transport system ATP-binding protein
VLRVRPESTLTASHLTRRFDTRLAVDDVSFELVPGEILALLGPNGAGKTTTLRMLGGLIHPTSGSVLLDRRTVTPVTAPQLRASIGFLTETPGLWERLTVRQNLTVYARLHGLASPAVAVDRMLDLFAISDRARDFAGELSKGLKQRVALARTLLHDPSIVLLDEPTAGLDPRSAHDVRELVLRLRDERRAVLLSTHNLDEVDRVADRVAVLRTRLVALDTPAALRTRLFGRRVRVELAHDAASHASMLRAGGINDVMVHGAVISVGLNEHVTVPGLVRRLIESGAAIHAVMPEERSLEDVYLRLLEEPQ